MYDTYPAPTLLIFGIMLTNKITSVNISHTSLQRRVGAVITLGVLGFLIPMITMFISDLLLFYIQGKPFGGGVIYLSFLAYVPIGFVLIKKIKIKNVLVGCLSGSTFFFIVTNFFVWLTPSYINVAKTSSSLFACYFDGLLFYGYQICGDIMWSAILFGIYGLSKYSIKKLTLLPTKD